MSSAENLEPLKQTKAVSAHSKLENVPKSETKKPWWQHQRAKYTGLVSLAVAIIGTAGWWFFIHPYVSTDDARVATTFVKIAAEQVNGRVIKLNVQEGDKVKKGDVLVELDHRMAEAQVQRTKAKATLAERDYRRASELVSAHSLAARELDTARANQESAEAELTLAQIALEHTTIKSPIDGIVVQKTTEEGNIVDPGQTLLTVSDTDHAWIAANIEETSVGAVKLGQHVHIVIDEGSTLEGKVSEIRESVASQFALIPADSGAGNFTKVVQRVPIKIQVENHSQELRAGQSAEIKIKVH